MPIIDRPISNEGFFQLSFQGNVHIYEYINLKRELARAITAAGGTNLQSYVHSSISFNGVFSGAFYNRFFLAINNVCNARGRPKVYFSLILAAKFGQNLTSHINIDGDEGLNTHFQNQLD